MEPYNTKDLTSSQTNKWRNDYPNLDIVPIITDKDLDISKLKSAVIIFHAVWSGPSYANVGRILQTLNNLNTKIRILIVDLDSVTDENKYNIIGCLCHGYAESAYVVDGKIVSRHSSNSNFDTYIDYLLQNIK